MTIRRSLFDSIKHVIQPIIETASTADAQRIADALERLNKAILVKTEFDQSPPTNQELTQSISLAKISKMQLLTCDEMLEATFSASQESSLKEILIAANRFTDVERALPESLTEIEEDYQSCYFSNVNAAELCALAKRGVLAELKEKRISCYRANEMTSWASVGFIETSLGRYNAGMIAAAYRNEEVLRYLVEKKGALINISIEENSKTVLNCAETNWFMYPENPEITAYLRTETQKNCKPTYRDMLLKNIGLFRTESSVTATAGELSQPVFR